MDKQYCGYVALVGAPNAGKSTLLNTLIESKLSIVTPKPQTTRTLIRGIVCEGNAQLIFIDTPGIFSAKPAYEKAMVDAAWSGVDDADQLLLLVDAHRGFDDDTRAIVESIKNRKKSAILVLNKVDVTDKEKLLELSQKLYAELDFQKSFMISGKLSNGVKDVVRYLAGLMPETPWLYPEDDMTDMNERSIASEITREECFLKLHAELPYSLMVDTEKWEEKQEKGLRVLRIHHTIIVERESQKKIILGSGGSMLKAIGSTARRKIGDTLGATVHLFLFVKVRDNWKSDNAIIEGLGRKNGK